MQAIAVGLRTGFGDDMLRFGQVKMLIDGALGPRTAWMLDVYETEPRTTGIPTLTVETVREAVDKANAAGIGCAIHAIGDRAVREVLDVYEEIEARVPRHAQPHRARPARAPRRPGPVGQAGRHRLDAADPCHVGHAYCR